MNSRCSIDCRVPALRSRRAAAILAAIVMTGAADARAAEWTWSVTPYVWAASVGANVSIADREIVDTTISVSELAKDLDATAQIHFEGQRGANGLFFDMFGVRLTTDDQTFAIPATPDASATLNSEIGMGVYELGGIYDPHGDQKGFALLYGTRVLDEDATINAQLALGSRTPLDRSYEMGDTLVDGMVGARYVQRFSRHWSGALRADASTGGTDFTWSATSTLAYSFGKRDQYAVTGGYRRMVVNFKDQDALHVDMTLSGFYTGFRFTF